MSTKGYERLIKLFFSENVKYIFGNPGTTELAIMEAIGSQQNIEYVLGLQEAIVVAMADGYARATGNLAVANVHVAPGLGNAMGSLYNAKFVGSPIILTAGQQEQGHGLMEPMLYAPLVPIAQPLVKWSIEVTQTEDLDRVVRRAAKIALTPPTGPVFISLPGDILEGDVEQPIAQPTRIDIETRPSGTVIEKITKRILASKNPVIIAGDEIPLRGALSLAGDLASIIGAPVWQQTIPHGSHFLSKHKCYQGHLSRNQQTVKNILQPHDLLIFLGSDVLRMSVMSTIEPIPFGKPIIHISENSEELGKNYTTEFAINTNIKNTLEALITQIEIDQTTQQKHESKKRLKTFSKTNWQIKKNLLVLETRRLAHDKPINPQYLMMTIAESIPDTAVIVEEGLSSTVSLLNFLSIEDKSRYFGLASGGIGFATAGAIGIGLGVRPRPVVAIIGDGSFMYSVQALWTTANIDLPITYVILNNQGYQILKQRLKNFRGSENFIGMSITDPEVDYVPLAKSMGIPAVKTENIKEIAELLRQSDGRQSPLLIDIPIAKLP